jgi:hypothetical protein
MMVALPTENRSTRVSLKQLFWTLMALFVPTAVALARIDVALRSEHAPFGIVSFEFCGYTGACAGILAEWGAPGREAAMLSLGLDYLFLLTYSGLLWAGLLMGSERLGSRARSWVRCAAVGALIAGLADAVENYALVQIVNGADIAAHGMLAGTLATVKFVLVGVALLVWLGLAARHVLVGNRDGRSA